MKPVGTVPSIGPTTIIAVLLVIGLFTLAVIAAIDEEWDQAVYFAGLAVGVLVPVAGFRQWGNIKKDEPERIIVEDALPDVPPQTKGAQPVMPAVKNLGTSTPTGLPSYAVEVESSPTDDFED